MIESGDRRRAPKPVTLDGLRRTGFRHLERFPTTTAHLRRKLHDRIRRAERRGATIPPEAAEWIETVLSELERAGMLDDRLWAKLCVQDLRRRGRSANQIRLKLRDRGLGEVEVQEALATEHRGEPGIAEERAALVHARRRRLGPFRPEEGQREEGADRERDPGKSHRALQSFARSGFPYDLAMRVLHMDPDGARQRLELLESGIGLGR